jgi:hypothetical protein
MSEGRHSPLEDAATPTPGTPGLHHFDTHELRAALCDYVQRCGEDQLRALVHFVTMAPEAELMLQNLDFFSREHREHR